MYTEENQPDAIDLDVRVKLLIIVEAGLLSFFTGKNWMLFAAFSSSLFVLLWFRQLRIAAPFILVFGIVFVVDFWITSEKSTVAGMVFGMLTFFILRMIPVLMLGRWLTSSVKINDFIASMEKMKMPASVIIPLAVTLRYMPTIKAEFRYIRNTMKMRGISLSAASVLKRPLMTAEYAMVPLLMRSIKVADELSASALTRGLGSNRNRTSYRDVCLNRHDMLWAVIFSALVIGLSIIQNFPILSLA